MSPTSVATIGQLQAMASLMILGEPSYLEVNNSKSVAFKSGIRNKKMLILFIIGCLVFISIISHMSAQAIRDIGTVKDRFILWRLGFQSVSDNLFGVGISNHIKIAEYIDDPFYEKISFLQNWMNWDRLGMHFHNVPLEAAWIAGIPGLIVYFWIFLLFIRGLYRCRVSGLKPVQAYIALSFFVLIISGWGDCTLYYPGLAVVAAVIFGMNSILLTPFPPPPERESRGTRSARTIVEFAALMMLEFFIVLVPLCSRSLQTQGTQMISTHPEKAEILLRTASKLTPWDAANHETMITMYRDSMRLDDMYHSINWLYAKHPEMISNTVRAGWDFYICFGSTEYLRHAVQLDPAGLICGEHQSDLALASYLNGDVETGGSMLKHSILLNPDIPGMLQGAFQSLADGFVIQPDTLKQYLENRMGIPVQREIKTPETYIPLVEIMSELEVELESSEKLNSIRKERFVKALFQLGNFQDTIRLLNHWKIPDERVTDDFAQIKTYREDDLDFVLMRAEIALKRKNYLDAEEKFTYVLTNGMDNARIRFGLGKIRMVQEKWAEAGVELHQAVGLAPDFPDAHANLGVVYYHMEDRQNAKVQFMTELRLNEYSVLSLFYLGTIYYEEGHFKPAYEYLVRARDLSPDDPWILFHIVLTLQRLNSASLKSEYSRLSGELKQMAENGELPREMIGKMDLIE